MPCAPIRSSRALSIDCTRGIVVSNQTTRRATRCAATISSIKMPGQNGEATPSTAVAFGRKSLLRTPHNGDEKPAVQQALRHPLHVTERDGVNQAIASIDVIDAEIFELNLHQLSGNLC